MKGESAKERRADEFLSLPWPRHLARISTSPLFCFAQVDESSLTGEPDPVRKDTQNSPWLVSGYARVAQICDTPAASVVYLTCSYSAALQSPSRLCSTKGSLISMHSIYL
eukprot:2116011-Pleurochrysis_carterae.AAC.1